MSFSFHVVDKKHERKIFTKRNMNICCKSFIKEISLHTKPVPDFFVRASQRRHIGITLVGGGRVGVRVVPLSLSGA